MDLHNVNLDEFLSLRGGRKKRALAQLEYSPPRAEFGKVWRVTIATFSFAVRWRYYACRDMRGLSLREVHLVRESLRELIAEDSFMTILRICFGLPAKMIKRISIASVYEAINHVKVELAATLKHYGIP